MFRNATPENLFYKNLLYEALYASTPPGEEACSSFFVNHFEWRVDLNWLNGQLKGPSTSSMCTNCAGGRGRGKDGEREALIRWTVKGTAFPKQKRITIATSLWPLDWDTTCISNHLKNGAPRSELSYRMDIQTDGRTDGRTKKSVGGRIAQILYIIIAQSL